MGQIYRWTINADGTLANMETINTVRTHAVAAGWEAPAGMAGALYFVTG